jgi:hypothetical protein
MKKHTFLELRVSIKNNVPESKGMDNLDDGKSR